VGRNCRFLQGADREQEGLNVIRAALAKHEACVVTLRNYRKNGELFLNRLSIRRWWTAKATWSITWASSTT